MDLHVLVQGARGITLFKDDRDRKTFRELLASSRGWNSSFHAATARGAYHLVLSDRCPLGGLRHDLNRRYSRAYKERHGFTRTVFPGSTWVFPLPGEFWRSRTLSAMASFETPMEVWKARVVWLMGWAGKHQADLGGESPRTIAVAWARRAGIPPRATAEALGYASGHSVSVMLDSIRKRARRDAGLRKAIGKAP